MNKYRISSKLFILLIVLIISFSCSLRNMQAVEQTILRYNELLAMGYAEMNMSGLGEVATENQVAKVYIHMAAMGEGKVRIVSDLTNILIKDIGFPEWNVAQATTREIWNYVHINIKTQKIDKTVEGIEYKLLYDLVRHKGKWFVNDVVSITEEQANDANKKNS